MSAGWLPVAMGDTLKAVSGKSSRSWGVVPPSEICRRCPGFHAHLRIEGAVAKHTAAYHPAVVDAMAGLAVRFVQQVRHAKDASLLRASGCERPAVSELAITNSWTTTCA